MKNLALLLCLLLSSCLFKEENGEPEKLLPVLGIENQDQIEKIEIQGLAVELQTLEELPIYYSNGSRYILYDTDDYYNKFYNKMAPLGVETFGENNELAVEYELVMNFETSDSVPNSIADVDLYENIDTNTIYLELDLDEEYYEQFPHRKTESLKEGWVVNVEWSQEAFKNIQAEYTDAELTLLDSTRYTLGYWQDLILGKRAPTNSGTFETELTWFEDIYTTYDTTVFESGSISVDSTRTVREYARVVFPEIVLENLITEKKKFQNLTVKLRLAKKSAGTATQAIRFSTELNSSSSPQIFIGGYNRDALISGWRAHRPEGYLLANHGDTLSLKPDFAKVLEALEKKGITAKGENLSELLLSGFFEANFKNKVQLLAGDSTGAWLRMYSELDSTENHNNRVIAEFQPPEKNESLKTGAAEYWIEPQEGRQAWTWWAGYGLRDWFRYAGTGEESSSFHLLLQTSAYGAVDPASDRVDLFANPALIAVPTEGLWNLTLFVLRAEGGEQ